MKDKKNLIKSQKGALDNFVTNEQNNTSRFNERLTNENSFLPIELEDNVEITN